MGDKALFFLFVHVCARRRWGFEIEGGLPTRLLLVLLLENVIFKKSFHLYSERVCITHAISNGRRMDPMTLRGRRRRRKRGTNRRGVTLFPLYQIP